MAKITIKDIAKKAEVGVGTVSRIINNHPGVKEKTREKVLKIIKELNFKPNSMAIALKRKKDNLVGIVIAGYSNLFFNDVISGIDSELKKVGLNSVVNYTELKDFSDIIKKLEDFSVKGIIYLGGRYQKKLDDIEIPLVLASTRYDSSYLKKYNIVTIDDREAAYKAVKYLIDTGCKKIAIIISNYKDELAQQRINGYKQALKESNLDYEFIVEGEYTAKGGYESAKEICLQNKPDGIFAISDLMAIGASRYLLENKYRVPEDVSIVGFDGIEESKYFYPSITTVEQPRIFMGELAAKLLIKEIENREKHTIIDKENICLDVKIVKRESSK